MDQTIKFFRFFFRMVPTLVIFLSLLCGLTILTITVWNQRRRVQQLSFKSPNPSGGGEALQDEEEQQQAKLKRKKSVIERQERQVQIQCLLYAVSFTNSTLWEATLTAVMIRDNANDTNIILENLWLPIVVGATLPLQGFWNFVIFLRPRYNDMHRAYPRSGRCHAFWNAVWNPSLQKDRHSSASRQSSEGAAGRSGSVQIDTTTPVATTDSTQEPKNHSVSFSDELR